MWRTAATAANGMVQMEKGRSRGTDISCKADPSMDDGSPFSISNQLIGIKTRGSGVSTVYIHKKEQVVKINIIVIHNYVVCLINNKKKDKRSQLFRITTITTGLKHHSQPVMC
jgi:hypothetical protein